MATDLDALIMDMKQVSTEELATTEVEDLK